MSLSEFEIRRIDKLFSAYCVNRIPAHLRARIRIEYRIRGNEVSLFESRAHVRGDGEWISTKVACFKKEAQSQLWHLYWADRNSQWQPYAALPSHRDIETLLQEVDKNATGAFWG